MALLDDEVAGISAGDVLNRYEAEEGLFLGEPQIVPREGAEEELWAEKRVAEQPAIVCGRTCIGCVCISTKYDHI